MAELNSFSRAAERLGIAQPVVSAHIKALSEKFGVPLTDRSGRRVTLTEEGQRVFSWARDVVGRTLELEREMAESKRGVVGKASVGASMTLGSYVLPGLVSQFRDRFPQGEVSVRVATPLPVMDAVHAGDCDFAFTILDPRHEAAGFDVQKVMDERLVLVGSERGGLAVERLEVSQLGEIPFVTAQFGTTRREIEEQCLARYDVGRRRIAMEFGHGESIKQAVRAGAGAAFLFLSSVRDELASGSVHLIETPGMNLQVPVYLVRRKAKRLSSFQLALMNDLVMALRARGDR
ncbi:LysR family transcriptional regulator [Mesorhizobium sp. L-8-10]|nr:LysR family transcriptional regulator [Mesorhizobium sp. L-8-10]